MSYFPYNGQSGTLLVKATERLEYNFLKICRYLNLRNIKMIKKTIKRTFSTVWSSFK